MSDLVLGTDDAVLTQFAELHVVVVLKGVTAEQNTALLISHSHYSQTQSGHHHRYLHHPLSLSHLGVKTLSMLQRADRGTLQDADVSNSFPS